METRVPSAARKQPEGVVTSHAHDRACPSRPRGLTALLVRPRASPDLPTTPLHLAFAHKPYSCIKPESTSNVPVFGLRKTSSTPSRGSTNTASVPSSHTERDPRGCVSGVFTK